MRLVKNKSLKIKYQNLSHISRHSPAGKRVLEAPSSLDDESSGQL